MPRKLVLWLWHSKQLCSFMCCSCLSLGRTAALVPTFSLMALSSSISSLLTSVWAPWTVSSRSSIFLVCSSSLTCSHQQQLQLLFKPSLTYTLIPSQDKTKQYAGSKKTNKKHTNKGTDPFHLHDLEVGLLDLVNLVQQFLFPLVPVVLLLNTS